MDTILKTIDLTKKYDNRPVVDNLNIEILSKAGLAHRTALAVYYLTGKK